jgi:regulator of protease activity HflC (stomatin/prohibitin superfamily)
MNPKYESTTKQKINLLQMIPLWLKIGIIVFILIFLITVLNPFVIIKPGYRGVKVTLGSMNTNVMGEGFHIKLPIFQRITKMNVQVQKAETDSAGASKDLQDVKMKIVTNHHVMPDKCSWIFQTIGMEYDDRIISPAVQETVKAIAAKYTAVELITQREKVRQEMKDLLRSRLSEYYIRVDDFAIVNFSFSKEFSQAIEGKQRAEQLALTAQRDLERVKFESEQKITQAKAEAESLRLQKENVTPELIKLRQIEASIKAISKWDGHMPKITGGALPWIGADSILKEK